jgi:hypothetical protein
VCSYSDARLVTHFRMWSTQAPEEQFRSVIESRNCEASHPGRAGTCILAGLLANVPVVVDIGKIEAKYEPKNKTMTLVDKWN